MLRIRLLGSLAVEPDGQAIARLEGQRYGAVLAQLAIRPGRVISRDVLRATGLISSLLARVPAPMVLVTSPRTLLIDGVHLVRLQPLEAPAVALHTDRIPQHHPDFSPDPQETATLASSIASTKA